MVQVQAFCGEIRKFGHISYFVEIVGFVVEKSRIFLNFLVSEWTWLQILSQNYNLLIFVTLITNIPPNPIMSNKSQ